MVLPSAPPGQLIRTVVAPMVAASDYPFRCLMRQHSKVDLAFTQMLHSRQLLENPSFPGNHCDFHECQPSTSRLSLLPAQDKILGGEPLASEPPCPNATRGPLIVQLAGYCPDAVTDAAQFLLDRTPTIAGFDLNLGCPQTIARKGRYGAFLMENEPETVYQILGRLRATLPAHVAVSAKIRLPLDESLQNERIQRLKATGINFLTVHGRDLTENKTKVGQIHLDRLRMAVEAAGGSLPVIANGGIETPDDVEKVLEATGAAAIMSSEALLERPNLFLTTSPKSSFHEQIGHARSYLDWCRYSPPLPGVLGCSFNIVRGHLFKFLFPYLQTHIDLREQLASRTCKTLPAAYELINTLEERGWDDATAEMTSWYRRHRRGMEHHNERMGRNRRTTPELTVDERKKEIRARIAHLQSSKRQKSSTTL